MMLEYLLHVVAGTKAEALQNELKRKPASAAQSGSDDCERHLIVLPCAPLSCCPVRQEGYFRTSRRQSQYWDWGLELPRFGGSPALCVDQAARRTRRRS